MRAHRLHRSIKHDQDRAEICILAGNGPPNLITCRHGVLSCPFEPVLLHRVPFLLPQNVPHRGLNPCKLRPVIRRERLSEVEVIPQSGRGVLTGVYISRNQGRGQQCPLACVVPFNRVTVHGVPFLTMRGRRSTGPAVVSYALPPGMIRSVMSCRVAITAECLQRSHIP
jgi:hypothetical protein